jgi:3-deoxy-D-manno-octulosonate 8-phosphate phosphatase (KDO 8-P phosphatase)
LEPKEFRNITQGKVVGHPDTLIKKLQKVRALIFDWDGIFNNGAKGQIPSTFSEIDSMGINMLRFGYYLLHKKNPVSAIVTGERNETAIHWAEREHFHSVYLKVKNKVDILDMLEKENNITRDEILFVFDDIHDLSLAKECGVKFLVRNKGARFFSRYCRKMNYCDYVTKNPGGDHALREISETVLNKLDLFEKTIEYRVEFKGIYSDYLQMRNRVETKIEELKYQ